MSRLNFKNLNREYTFKEAPTIRYNKSDNSFTIRTLDSLDGENYFKYRISEPDLLRMISIDKYDKDEQNEMFYKRLLPNVEQCELDDDTYNSVSVCQYYFTLSSRTITLAKRQAHLYKLGKADSPVLKLSPHVFHSKGGRPLGSRNKMSEEEKERLEYLKDNFVEIEKNCLVHDWYEQYVSLYKDLGRKTNYKEYCDKRLDLLKNKC